MSVSNIIFAAVCWLCSFVFGAVAIWAFKRKDPMHFWSGSTVRPEEISDIPAYNRANGFMWTVFTACFVVTGLVSLFSIRAGSILLVIFCVPGTGILIAVYNRIYSKYKNKSAPVAYTTDGTGSKTPKAVIITAVVISVIFFAGIGVLFASGEKDPDINIYDDYIQIKAMYGVNIDLSEIADISLIDKSVRDIDIGRRTNGYGGIAGALKGNFKSDTLGETLLFAQSKSSPTIKIERTDRKDVYISFKDSAATEQLYHELREKIPL